MQSTPISLRSGELHIQVQRLLSMPSTPISVIHVSKCFLWSMAVWGLTRYHQSAVFAPFLPFCFALSTSSHRSCLSVHFCRLLGQSWSLNLATATSASGICTALSSPLACRNVNLCDHFQFVHRQGHQGFRHGPLKNFNSLNASNCLPIASLT